VRDQIKKKTVYEGPDVESIPELINELVNSLNYLEYPHTIIKAAMAHLNLVMIHPFSDGNGRMARCLQTLVMAKEGILEPTFCSIEEYLGKNTQEYYNVLAEVGQGSYNPTNDATKWIRFNITAHYRQATTLVRRTQIMRRLWDELENEITHYDLPPRVLVALAEAAVGHRVRNPVYRAQAEVSENVAGRDLKAMVDAGFLVPHGEKRGRDYIASELTKEIFNRVYEPPKDIDPYEKPPKGTLYLPFIPPSPA
jgi:Fic family protein